MNRILKKLKLDRVFLVFLCTALISCHVHKDIVYLQDANNLNANEIGTFPGIEIQPKDILSIIISSREPLLSMDLNLPYHSYQAGSNISSGSYSQRLLGYQVDVEGYIDFPLFGRMKVEGMTRDQLSHVIKQKIIDEGQIKNPIVITEFMNFKISVLGEVKNPGMFYIQDDKITIFEAIGRAGDLTIYGRRDNVLVQREQNGKVISYRVDLRSTDIIRSPVFYLQQNDVVYITPNNTVAARSRINENRTLGVGISMASLLANIVMLIYTLQ